MRHYLSNLTLVLFLFVSVEGAADMVVHGLPHDHSIIHEKTHDHSADELEGEHVHADSDGLHCDHCCHAHFSSIAHLHAISFSVEHSGETMELSDDAMPEFLITPPTPPPDPTCLS